MAVGAYTSDPKVHHIANMVQLGFYFCLESCEYTKFTGRRRTFQFRSLFDYVLFIGESLLPVDAPIDQFRQATQIVLTLENQKNAI